MSLSKRIQNLAQSDDFLLADSNTDLEIDFSSSKRKLILAINIISGQIDDFSYQGTPSTLEKAIYEAFGRLNQKSYFWALKGPDKREMKNYLQDTNDNSAFSKEFENEFNEILSHFPVLISKIFIKKALKLGEKLKDLEREQNEFGQLIIQMRRYYFEAIAPLLGAKCALGKIYHWDAPYLTFLSRPGQSPIPYDLLRTIEEIYRIKFQISGLKVVAVEEKYI
jgi:hypothetical protein